MSVGLCLYVRTRRPIHLVLDLPGPAAFSDVDPRSQVLEHLVCAVVVVVAVLGGPTLEGQHEEEEKSQ